MHENTEKVINFKNVCFKLGFLMTVFFISGVICTLFVNFTQTKLLESSGVTAAYISRLILSGVFLYVIPIITGLIIFREDNAESGDAGIVAWYKKPPRLSKAIGNFPAMYGLGQLTNMTVLLIVWLISSFTSGAATEQEVEAIERSFGAMNSLLPPNMTCGIALFIYMTLAAAIFEEFMCRGIMLTALKPYGNGFAIIVSGFLFGIMHGNFQQFSYAFVLGIVLAYITLQSGSILASTILHAMFNSIAATMMLFLSTDVMQEYIFDMGIAGSTDVSTPPVIAAFGIFMVLFFGLLIMGIALAVKKLIKLKSYKLNNSFSEISTKQKTAIFFRSVTVIMMLLLTVDRFAGGFIALKLYELLF